MLSQEDVLKIIFIFAIFLLLMIVISWCLLLSLFEMHTIAELFMILCSITV